MRLTTACGSLVIALALMEGRLDAAAAFAVSQLDETFQIEALGRRCRSRRAPPRAGRRHRRRFALCAAARLSRSARPVDGARPAGALSHDAKNLTNRHRRARDASAAARRYRRAAAPSAGMRASGTGLCPQKRRAAELLECVPRDARRRPISQRGRMPKHAQLWMSAAGRPAMLTALRFASFC